MNSDAYSDPDWDKQEDFRTAEEVEMDALETTRITENRLSRLTMTLALCEEFTAKVDLDYYGQIIAMVHKKWIEALETRCRAVGWRFKRMSFYGPFRIVTLVDSYR